MDKDFSNDFVGVKELNDLSHKRKLFLTLF